VAGMPSAFHSGHQELNPDDGSGTYQVSRRQSRLAGQNGSR